VTVAARKANDPRPAPPIVLYAPLGELKVYEISEAELEKLENGPPGQIHLSFALALLPAALTILVTLQTVTIANDRLYYGYLIAFWALSVQGLISLIQWFFKRRSYRRLINDIRARMPAKPGIPEQLVAPPSPEPEQGEDTKRQ
jgi:hypothetical protein